MSEPNGKARLALIGTLLTGAGLLFGLGGGWLGAVRTDAAFKERAEIHLQESQAFPDDIAELKTTVAVNNAQINALTKNVNDLAESQQRLTDKIDLLIQSQMREGRIPR